MPRPLELEVSEKETVSPSPKPRPLEIEDKDISRFRSLISAPLKGVAKELPNVRNIMEPWRVIMGPTNEDKIYEEMVEKNLPTQPEFAEGALEKFGKNALYGASGGVGGLVRAAIGSALGQYAKEKGASPLTQFLAEAGPQGAPSFSRTLKASSPMQQRMLNLGRQAGASEEQMAPWMSGEGKRRFLGSFASKGESTTDKMRESRKATSSVYNYIRESPGAKEYLSQPEMQRMAREVARIGENLPYNVRSQLHHDAADLVRSSLKKGGIQGTDLMNFYQDISSRYNLGRKQLELFKTPIRQAIESINPRLARDFDTANNIFIRQNRMAKSLTPNDLETYVNMGEAVGVAGAAATGNVSLLTKLLGFIGVRKFANAMLTSPRLQNLVKKSQDAVSQNRVPLMRKLGDLIVDTYKDDPNEE